MYIYMYIYISFSCFSSYISPFVMCACNIIQVFTRVCIRINASTNMCIIEHIITRIRNTFDGSFSFFFFLANSVALINIFLADRDSTALTWTDITFTK